MISEEEEEEAISVSCFQLPVSRWKRFPAKESRAMMIAIMMIACIKKLARKNQLESLLLFSYYSFPVATFNSIDWAPQVASCAAFGTLLVKCNEFAAIDDAIRVPFNCNSSPAPDNLVVLEPRPIVQFCSVAMNINGIGPKFAINFFTRTRIARWRQNATEQRATRNI